MCRFPFRLTVIAAAAFVVPLLIGCGGGGVVPPRPLGLDATAEDVYAGAVEAMANVTSYRWVADIDAAFVATGETWTEHVEGVWAAADNYEFVATSYKPSAKVALDQLPFVYHYRVLEGRAFLEDEQGWREKAEPRGNGVPRLRGSSELPDVSELGFSRNVTSSSFYALIGSESTEGREGGLNRLAVEIGIDHQSLRVVSLQQTFTQPNGSTYRIATRFFRFNEPVSIELPENRIDLPGLGPPAPTATHTPTT